MRRSREEAGLIKRGCTKRGSRPGVGENAEHMKMPWECEQCQQSGQKFSGENGRAEMRIGVFFSFENLLTRTQLDVYSQTSKTSCVQLKPMGMGPLQHSFRRGTCLSPETGLRSLARVIKRALPQQLLKVCSVH